MQPQLPTEDARQPAPRNLKTGAWVLALLAVAVGALIFFLLPKKATLGPRQAAPTTEQRAREQTPYANPHP